MLVSTILEYEYMTEINFKITCVRIKICAVNRLGPTVEQQTEVARSCGRTLASLHPDQVMSSALWFKLKECNTDLLWIIVLPAHLDCILRGLRSSVG